MMQEEYTTVSEPESVDGYLAIMIGDQVWCQLFSEDKLSSAVEFILGRVGDRAKHIEGNTIDTVWNELTAAHDSVRIDATDVTSSAK